MVTDQPGPPERAVACTDDDRVCIKHQLTGAPGAGRLGCLSGLRASVEKSNNNAGKCEADEQQVKQGPAQLCKHVKNISTVGSDLPRRVSCPLEGGCRLVVKWRRSNPATIHSVSQPPRQNEVDTEDAYADRASEGQ